MSGKVEKPLAFPRIAYLDRPDNGNCRAVIYEDNGISLRDYFAAESLPTLIDQWDKAENIAREAYKIADAMLQERANPK